MTVQRKVSSIDVSSIGADIAPIPEEPMFDLAGLLRVIRVRQQIIVGTAAIVVALTALILFQLTPRYSASALVMLEQRQNKVVDVDAVLSGLPTDAASIENQVQILTSRNLMLHVVDKLHLERDPEFSGGSSVLSLALSYINPRTWFGTPVSTQTDAQKLDQLKSSIVDRLINRMTAASQGRSTAIRIQFESTSPEKAATVANAIADAYVEDQLNAKFEATQKATQWLADRIQELSTQVQTAEAAVAQYKAENNLTETVGGGSIVDQQLAQLNGQLVNARSDLAEQEAKYSRVNEMQRTGHSSDVSQVVASPLILQLRGQETDLLRQEAEMSSKYGPRHPKMLDLESQKKNLEAKIDEEVQRVVQTVASDVAVARARVRSLEGSLAELSGESTVQNKAKVKLQELEASATSSRSLYEAFLSRFKETQGQQDIQTPDARVISKAEVPKAASFPNKPLTFGVAIPGGLFLGFLLALMMERLDSGFRTTAHLERLVGLPVLSTLPEIPGLAKIGKSAADRIIEKPMSSFAEAIRGLQMGLVLSSVDKKPKVILVTSSVPDEGKTTVAISLARLAARSGQKVVIVDGDLRRPSIANSLGISRLGNGVVEAILGSTTLDQCLCNDPRSDALVLPAVKAAANPPDLLGSVAMERFIAGLRTFYDLVVIDSAPLLPVNDTKVLARLADSVLFAVRWEKTPRDAVITAARALADVRAPVAGIVFTRADATRYQYYSYGYQDYYAYNKYYSD